MLSDEQYKAIIVYYNLQDILELRRALQAAYALGLDCYVLKTAYKEG